jgi:hypothetical protein
MTAKDRKAVFLEKAQKADERASTAKDQFLRQAWEEIAADYRALARTCL